MKPENLKRLDDIRHGMTHVVDRLYDMSDDFRRVGNEFIADKIWTLASELGEMTKDLHQTSGMITGDFIADTEQATRNMFRAAFAVAAAGTPDPEAKESLLQFVHPDEPFNPQDKEEQR